MDGNTPIRAHAHPKSGDQMVKTTIELDEELWKKFSIKVIQKYGGRKKTDIFEALAEAFVNTPEKMVQEAVEDWIRQRKDKKKRSH